MLHVGCDMFSAYLTSNFRRSRQRQYSVPMETADLVFCFCVLQSTTVSSPSYHIVID